MDEDEDKKFKNATDEENSKFGCIDCILDMLPQIHIKGYNYCGINTNLETHSVHNVMGINELDCACKEHDIAYSESTSLEWRYIADKILILRAIKRIYASNSTIGERIAALIVTLLISIKMLLTKIEIYIGKIRFSLAKRKVTIKDADSR